ncbi:glycoside hydrolase family 140 protein [Novipirellula artificiosorum]|uniref:Putative endoglucanase n=1 Tax=Novipirellula artificiosorum TaxID=2528016 RepID=A0A5C6D4X0_9BACT|nr:glycoside hydrolase family 140 protein [Novipirellula artificiosorum]TWU31818.1 putative endoglucanase [Novipirellula artificiosorum]
MTPLRNKVPSKLILLTLGFVLLAATSNQLAADPPRLQVHDNDRFLVTEDGTPFFWVGDTTWSMVRQSVREATDDQPEVELYFKKRKEQGFNVVQTSLLTIPVRGKIDAPNVYGHLPFIDGDFSRPRVIPGPANDYWDHVDDLVDLAAKYDMYMAVVVAWSTSLETDEHPLVADPDVAYAYGHFLGDRYRERTHLIWLLGGDAFGQPERATLLPARREMTRTIAEGIADGVNGVHNQDSKADWSSTMMTYHPPGGGVSSSRYFHEEPWLDFNMIQSTTRFSFRNYETVAADYEREPPKPTFDAEVAYEYSLSLNKREVQEHPNKRISPWDVRRAAYWNVFAGGCGHTYGHRNLIGWVCKGDGPLKYGANQPWFDSLDAAGAQHLKHLSALVKSRPMLLRIPDQSLIVAGQGDGNDHIQACRASDGSYAFVYLPTGIPVTIDLDKFSGEKLTAHWYNPRTGESSLIGTFPASGHQRFEPSEQDRGSDQGSDQGSDWVLILDDE